MGNIGNIIAEDADTFGMNEAPATARLAWLVSSVRQPEEKTSQLPADKQRMRLCQL